MKLKIVLETGMDGYIVAYCPALKGCVTQGRTEEEALQNLKEAIELYLEAVKPLDRAGAYTVEGIGGLLVERFEGCYYNVLGLPLAKLDEMLRTIGANLFLVAGEPARRGSV